MSETLLISGYSQPGVLAPFGLENPSWLVQNPPTDSGDILFAVGESSSGKVARFRRDERGEWIGEDTADSGGALPCHAALVGNTLVVAHYGDGAVVAFPEAPIGPLRAQALISGVPGAHAHGVFPLPDAGWFFVVDLGLETVTLARMDNDGANFRIAAQLDCGGATGPRHLALHPALQRAYLVTEYSNELLTLVWSTGPARLTIMERRSLLPADFHQESFGGSVRVSPDGGFVLATNRGHNSVVSFALDANGLPREPAWTTCGGSWPRDLVLNPTGDRLAVANQRSDQVIIFTRDTATGQLSPISTQAWHQPSCVLWE